MNELIINGIDHSVFNLEWAKRGGVMLVSADKPVPSVGLQGCQERVT